MSLPLFVVDAFTDRPFAGNPAAVVWLDVMPDDDRLGDIAAEMNLSETAFVRPRAGGHGGEFDLRWFTPAKIEVDLCGHATLAAAHTLWAGGRIAPSQPITFHTRSGPLAASQNDGWIELDFPADPPRVVEGVPLIGEAIGEWPRQTLRGRFDYLVELDSAEAVRSLQPDMALLRGVETRGLIVTARAGRGEPYDFVSRFFAPSVGVDEDPVTGSAHCTLAPYWSAKLRTSKLIGFQASRRGGIVKVETRRDRVALQGQATTIIRGTLEV